MKKAVLLLSTIIASSLLVGGTFAAFAVIDYADHQGFYGSPKSLEEDEDTKYITISWGSSTSINDIENLSVGSSYKVGVFNLVSSQNYNGVLSLTLVDESTSHSSSYRLIDYLRFYLYEGAQNDVENGELPEATPLVSTNLKETSFTYTGAQGTPAGKEYSLFVTYDNSASPYSTQISSDVVGVKVDWNPQSSHIGEDDRTIYFASSWENAYIYAWNDNTYNSKYPGVAISKVGKNQYNQNIFKGTLPGTYDYMILSNGGTDNDNKTNNIDIRDYTFGDAGLLFWRNNDGSVGYKEFENSDVTDYASNLGENPGAIFQAWGWTTEKVRQNLSNIKEAGFKAVQLSPIQPVGGGSSPEDKWYMLYQPLGFKVADAGENPIGTKTSLSSLTAAADELDMKIIVDVVANHLSGDKGVLYEGVRPYETKIYDEKLIHNDGNVGEDEGDTYNIVRGHVGGMPDLQTENEYVQGRVISMLKEYVDCGVKGFRFDAAKHIETHTDGSVASDFWQNVIGAINQYGIQEYGEAPYSYGEVLGVGTYRSYSGYTDYLDVTDNGICWMSRVNFVNSDEGGVVSYSSYSVGSGTSAVLFNETHDNYIHNGTASVNAEKMNMLYGLHASRVSSNSLYFARPSDGENLGNNTKIVINNPATYYQSAVVRNANKLHEDFKNGTEYVSAWGGCVINAVYLNGKYGVYICNPDAPSSATIKVKVNDGYLPTGTYTNLMNNQVVSVYYDTEFTVPLVNGVAILEIN